jgi:hypothetical protein
MQTFLPYKSYTESARVLDDKRLGKQRVENLQILKALILPEYGWKNHPAVKMWVGYEQALSLYQIMICKEWTDRGFKDTCLDKTFDLVVGSNQISWNVTWPEWLGNEKFHASHRSNLLRKDPEWYGQFGWTEPDDLEYYWPTKHYWPKKWMED